MKKYLILLAVLCFAVYAKAQTLIPTTPGFCAGGTFVFTGNGSESLASYFTTGNKETITSAVTVPPPNGGSPTAMPVSDFTIVEPLPFENWYSTIYGTPTKYEMQVNMVSSITVPVKLSFDISLWKKTNGNTTLTDVTFTEIIYPSCTVTAPAAQNVTFNVTSNNSQMTYYSLSDNGTTIHSGGVVWSTNQNIIYTSFAPYTSLNPYTQITSNRNSVVVMYVTGGHLPANAFINTGNGAISGVITPSGPNMETITFNGVNISSEPLAANISLQ